MLVAVSVRHRTESKKLKKPCCDVYSHISGIKCCVNCIHVTVGITRSKVIVITILNIVILIIIGYYCCYVIKCFECIYFSLSLLYFLCLLLCLFFNMSYYGILFNVTKYVEAILCIY